MCHAPASLSSSDRHGPEGGPGAGRRCGHRSRRAMPQGRCRGCRTVPAASLGPFGGCRTVLAVASGAMTHTTHEFDRYEDVRVALADPALVPQLPPADDGPAGASVAWLRATVARFSSGEPHRRRRALVEAELAELAPTVLRRSVAAGSEEEVRVRVVRSLAETLGMPEPRAVAEAVTVVAGAYFGGTDPAADAAVARLVAELGPADEAGLAAAATRTGCWCRLVRRRLHWSRPRPTVTYRWRGYSGRFRRYGPCAGSRPVPPGSPVERSPRAMWCFSILRPPIACTPYPSPSVRRRGSARAGLTPSLWPRACSSAR